MYPLKKRLLCATGAVVIALTGLAIVPTVVAAAEMSGNTDQGRKLANDRKKGNCVACHMMAGSVSPGNIGPPLVAMKARYPEKAKLRAKIWDSTVANPVSTMPPFGKHKILSEKEIDAIAEYI